MRLASWILILAALQATVLATTWTVEKDGSGDFTVIQDALDACAPGDSVLIGPGRFADFRPGASTVDGWEFQGIAWVTVPDVTIIGSGMDSTTIGPATLVETVLGKETAGFYVDGGAQTLVAGVRTENVKFPMSIRRQTTILSSAFHNNSDKMSVVLLEGEGTTIESCEFYGGQALLTATSAVVGLQLLNCRVSGDDPLAIGVTIGNGSTDALISRCTISGYGGGVQTSLSGSVTIEDTQFSDIVVSAIDLSSGAITMRRCTIAPAMRFPLRVNNGLLQVYHSVIGGGTNATILVWGDMLVRNSHLENGGALTVDSRAPLTRSVDLAQNWWGTTDHQLIESWISALNPNVVYQPILESPVSIESQSFGGLKQFFSGPDSGQ